MSIGTIITYPANPRVAKSQIAALYSGVEVSVDSNVEMGKTNKSPEFLAKFPHGAVPVLETTGGSCIFESDAIAYYTASQQENSPLLGVDKVQAAQILQWILFANGSICPSLGTWLAPVFGYGTFNKVTYNNAVAALKRSLGTLDAHFLRNTFFVGERISLADITIACDLKVAFSTIFDPAFRKGIPNVTRWFTTIMAQPHVAATLGEVTFAEKEAQPKKDEKAAPAPKKVETAAVAAEEPAAPKAKSALDLLPKSSFNLEDWKRFYSNNDTKPDAMDYFWKNLDREGYSIWKVDYKYNDELTKVFMSSNLIGGFFARLERARKYVFASLLVMGEDNNSAISGYFVIRGQEVPFEVYDAADYDSYNFTKVENLDDEKTRALIADYFAWEGDFEGGMKFADGKIFK
ncbi:hypothetical protein BJ684DRAFT_20814 [Piptocephalis cylindrospora]|uniref:Elongation factor 1-gamma n=1 Tax=Piptocephalis cylindrospora TaxID=1907219 RepID=A0A4P9Y4A1_9FUNG|nr:hypothetical protein BJ684DRAFT_20814 [Piptocephalis cylindrospora]|eukprot:RKP12660.1 hypothetical protein BJ684DRAFT_20814 [Piptocephalis cylindrospora]